MGTDETAEFNAYARADRAETQLWQALDSMSEALAFYDSEERLVLYNSRYRELYPGLADAPVPGSRFEAIMWMGRTRGLHLKDSRREAEWCDEGKTVTRPPGPPRRHPRYARD